MDKIQIKKLTRFEEFERCVAIQKEVWRHEDLHVTPVHLFCVTSHLGAILLGGFINGELAGFVYSFPAIFKGKLSHHSHLLAVLPEFQGYGIGKKLKWAQRDWVMRAGLDLVTWTVDPLQARNANLNLSTLGAVTRTYLPNFYGLTPSLTFGPGLPTDRFLMEWPVREKRVEMRRKEKAAAKTGAAWVPKAVEGVEGKGNLRNPGKPRLSLDNKILLVEILRDIKACGKDYKLIAAWQDAVRRAMKHYFSRGYLVVDFIFGDRCFYVLEKT